MIVVDASALIAVLTGQKNGDEIWERLIAARGSLHILHLTDIEVAQTLRRFVLRGYFDSARGEAALSAFRTLALTRHTHAPLLQRVWILRDNITAYDAAYIALAEALGAPVLTCDRRLANTAGHTATVELVS